MSWFNVNDLEDVVTTGDIRVSVVVPDYLDSNGGFCKYGQTFQAEGRTVFDLADEIASRVREQVIIHYNKAEGTNAMKAQLQRYWAEA